MLKAPDGRLRCLFLMPSTLIANVQFATQNCLESHEQTGCVSLEAGEAFVGAASKLWQA